MHNEGGVPFLSFFFLLPFFHTVDYVVSILCRYQHTADDVLRVESQGGIQYFVQLLGKVDGHHDEPERDDVLHRQEQTTRQGRTSSLTDALDRRNRTAIHMAEVRVKHRDERKDKQDAEV